MKKYGIFALSLVLSLALLTGCGCTNSKPANTQPSTLPPTTGATLMPTTEATTTPTTMTTTPATEPTTIPDTTESMTPDGTATEATNDTTDSNAARGRMPAMNGK